MTKTLLAIWDSCPAQDICSVIVPDGCRDLIMSQVKGEQARWFVSPLYDQAETIALAAGTRMCGFRLQPGVYIDEHKLLTSIEADEIGDAINNDDILSRLDDFTCVNSAVNEALCCLAGEVHCVAEVAKTLGVSQRTLQRLLLRETARPPVYWLMLARIRRTARALPESGTYADIADQQGYADQSHMCREFRRWFGMTPSALKSAPKIIQQINATGYD